MLAGIGVFVARLLWHALWLKLAVHKLASVGEGSEGRKVELSGLMLLVLAWTVAQAVVSGMGFLGLPVQLLLWGALFLVWIVYFTKRHHLRWTGALALYGLFVGAELVFRALVRWLPLLA